MVPLTHAFVTNAVHPTASDQPLSLYCSSSQCLGEEMGDENLAQRRSILVINVL